MMKKEYRLGNEVFVRKEDIAARAKKLKNSTPAGTALSGSDLVFIRALLDWHPRAEEKIGPGIFSISVGPNLLGEPHFILRRLDGTTESFSYRKCVQWPSRRTEVSSAFREAVCEQTVAAKLQAFGHRLATIACPFTGRVVSFDEADVDHIPPDTFVALFNRFLRERGLTVEAVQLDDYRGEHIGRVIADDALRRAWQDYHRAHAKLRVISAEANRRIVPRMAKDKALR